MAEVLLYAITSRTTGKMYVGITTRELRKRWRSHIDQARRDPRWAFQKAILKHGPDDFELTSLYVYPAEDEAKYAEVEIISQLDLMTTGYNSSPGGDFNTCSETAKAKLRAHNLGRRHSDETRAKISRSKMGQGRGRVHSAETKAKISAAHVGKTMSPAARAAMVAGWARRRHRLTSEAATQTL